MELNDQWSRFVEASNLLFADASGRATELIKILPEMLGDRGRIFSAMEKIGAASDSRHMKSAADDLMSAIAARYAQLERLNARARTIDDLKSLSPQLRSMMQDPTTGDFRVSLTEDQVRQVVQTTLQLPISQFFWACAFLTYFGYIEKLEAAQSAYLGKSGNQRFTTDLKTMAGGIASDVAGIWFPLAGSLEAALAVGRSDIDRRLDAMRSANTELERIERLIKAFEAMSAYGDNVDQYMKAAVEQDQAIHAAFRDNTIKTPSKDAESRPDDGSFAKER